MHGFDAFTSQEVSCSRVEKNNQILSQAQKELLQWHWRLGHFGFQQIQKLFRSSKFAKPCNHDQVQGMLFMSYTSFSS